MGVDVGVDNRWASSAGYTESPPTVRYRIRECLTPYSRTLIDINWLTKAPPPTDYELGEVVERTTNSLRDDRRAASYLSLNAADQLFADLIAQLVQKACGYFYLPSKSAVSDRCGLCGHSIEQHRQGQAPSEVHCYGCERDPHAPHVFASTVPHEDYVPLEGVVFDWCGECTHAESDHDESGGPGKWRPHCGQCCADDGADHYHRYRPHAVSDDEVRERIHRLDKGENTREAERTAKRAYPISELPWSQQRALIEQVERLKHEWAFEIIGEVEE